MPGNNPPRIASLPIIPGSNERYLDELEKRNGEWRIANRVVIVEGCYDIQDSATNAITPPAYGPDEICPASRDKSDVSYQRPLRPRQPRDHH